MIEPLLLYMVLKFGALKIIEQTRLQFCKRVLKVRSTTPNFMVYGELGRFPLEVKKIILLIPPNYFVMFM